MDSNLYSNIKTPYYIIDEEKLNNNFKSMKEEFEKEWFNFSIGYSFKTNSLPWVLDWMKNKGTYAEVVSEKEYELALHVGYEPSKIIFNGPYKGVEALKFALDNGSIVNLDSFHEVEWIKNNRPLNGHKWLIGLRINFKLESYCNGETIMGEEVGRFGFNIENGSFKKAVDIITKMDYVDIVGLHGHHSTKTKSLKVFKTIANKICEVARYIGKTLEYVDIGGCLFGDKPNTPTFKEYANIITEELESYFDKTKTKLIVEPGAALIASPVEFVCKVVDVKEIIEKKVITTDGSCHNINPSMSNIKFDIDILTQSKDICSEQIVAGYTCIEKDRMAILKDRKAVTNGDILIFKNTGAYSMSLEPLFIRYFPAVFVYKNGELYYARKEWGVEEYMAKSYFGYSLPIKERNIK